MIDTVTQTLRSVGTDGWRYKIDITRQPPMRISVDVQDATWSVTYMSTQLAYFPAATGSTKLFWPKGKGLPTWDSPTTVVPDRMVPHLCFVDMPTQVQWLAFLDAMPDGPWDTALITYAQEGDRKLTNLGLTQSQFVSNWDNLIQWSAKHPKRGRIKLVVNLTWYWQHYHNNDDYEAFIPDAIDALGVDIYPGTQTNYTSPADCLARPIAAAKALALDLIIPEFGVVVPTNPMTAQLQAQTDWMLGMLDTGEAAGVWGMSWWQATGNQGDFRLKPSTSAYDALTGRMSKYTS